MSRPRTRRALQGGLALMALSMALGGAADSAKADGTEISFTPRIWYNFYSDSEYNHNFNSSSTGDWATASKAFELPFYGGTVTLKNPQVFGAGTLAVTVLNGDARTMTSGIMSFNNDGSGLNLTGEDEVHRLDAEALFILPVRSNVSLFMGGRYIGFDWKRSIDLKEYPGNALGWNEKNDAYYGELGVGLSAPVTESGRHIVFANLVGLLGRTDKDWTYAGITDHTFQWSGGVDANVGYAYQMTQDVKLSARYRLFARAQLDHWSSEGNELMHGPEVGLTYTIGRGEQPLK
jgi:hypothetical protein